MKNRYIFRITAIILASICIWLLPLSCYAESRYGVNSKLPTFSSYVIHPTIGDVVDIGSEYIQEMKADNTYSDYIKFIRDNWSKYVPAEKKNTLNDLEQDHIPSTITVKELKEKAQKELDQNYNKIQIESQAFRELLTNTIQDNENSALEKIHAKEKALYYFMCIADGFFYDDKESNVINHYHLKSLKDLEQYSLADLVEIDAEQNFSDTIVPNYSYSFITRNVSYWHKLNSQKIITYAEKYALKSTRNTKNYLTENINADCTNFASQCLHAGGLSMKYSMQDTYKRPKLVISKESQKWYNLKKANHVSTTWIRARELYKYLAPHYQTFESYSASQINRQLKYGYLMQGRKPFHRYSHSIIITHGQTQKLGYCAHSSYRRCANLSYFYAHGGYIEYRIVKVC